MMSQGLAMQSNRRDLICADVGVCEQSLRRAGVFLGQLRVQGCEPVELVATRLSESEYVAT